MSRSYRYSNIEILRLISIILIILNHYSAYGGFSFKTPFSINAQIVQFLHIGGKLGVDIFILISGFFLSTSKSFKFEKLVKLFGEILFYSCILALIGILLGSLSTKQIFKMLLAVPYGEWEFITCYIMLYCLSPWINIFLHNASFKQHFLLVVFLGFVWCVIPTFTNADFAMSTLTWYIFLYILSSLLRRTENVHGYVKRPGLWILSAVGIIILIMLSEICLNVMGYYIPQLSNHAEHFRAINSVTTTTCAVCFLLGFRALKIRAIPWINCLASTTLGVFMLHDNGAVRNVLWGTIFRNRAFQNSAWLIVHALISAFLILIVGAGIDLCRQNTVEKWFINISQDLVQKSVRLFDNQIEKITLWLSKSKIK